MELSFALAEFLTELRKRDGKTLELIALMPTKSLALHETAEDGWPAMSPQAIERDQAIFETYDPDGLTIESEKKIGAAD